MMIWQVVFNIRFSVQQQSMKEDDEGKAVEAAVKIQSVVRGVQTRERVKRLLKDFFKRRMIIKQLLDTEQNYIRDLSIVISDYQTPLLNHKIISKDEALVLFINIDQIRRLNELFFVTIFEEAKDYSHYKVIFEKVEKEVHFFKMYFEYLNNYALSSTTIDQLMERKPFADFVDRARLNPSHKLLTLKDYLIKPVQRLPKYVLIMKQIKKRTSSDHPDYVNICRVLGLFEEVNHSNNQKLNRVVNNYKINQIEKKLLIPHVISEPGVEFVLEEPVTVISNDVQIVEATLYLLNTELIVAKKYYDGKEKFMVSVPFKNGGGNIMSNEDHYFYKNTFTVQNGEGDNCTFLCSGQEEKEALIQKIYNQLMKAEQRTLEKLSILCNVKNGEGVQFLKKMSRLDLLPDVEILGTDERNDNMFKYTAYIIQIRIKAIRQKIFVRYKELLALQDDLKQEYGITLKNELMKTTWMTNHKPKKIEERKMAIQRFLKEILSKQEIIQHGEEVLYRLGLPSDFYKLPDIYKDSENILKKSAYQRSTSDLSEEEEYKSVIRSKRVSIFQAIPELEGKEDKREKGRQKSRRLSIQDILKANELHLGHFTRYTQIMNPKNKKVETYSIDVLIPWIQNEKGYVKQTVLIQKDERVLTLVQQLAKKIELKYYKDFRLILERDFASRMLDDDECLVKVMQQIKSGKYVLIFKKVIYVAADIEEQEFRSDRVRLKIIASQVIYDCKKDKYLLDYQMILRLTVLIGITQHFTEVEQQYHKGSTRVEAEDEGQGEKKLKEVLLDKKVALSTRSMIANAYTSFYDSTSTWIQDYQKMLPVILKRLKEISQTNTTIFRTSGIRDCEKQYNTTDIGQLASISIITEMKSNVFFGSISFVVQISQWFREYLKKFGSEEEDHYDNRNCWLIIKYDSMHLYSISLRNCIFSFNYEQLYKIEPYPSSIRLYLREREIDYLKLKTTNSYTIRQMLLYYKNYNDIVKKMDEDENFEHSMIELVKEESRQSNLRDSFYPN